MEKELWDQESRQLHKVHLWGLLWVAYTCAVLGKDNQKIFTTVLYTSKRGKGYLKEPKLKTESDYQVQSLSGKNSACQCRRPEFSHWIRKILWRRTWQPIPVFLLGKSHGQRNLVDYSPWGCKELDMTWQLNNSNRVRSTNMLIETGRFFSSWASLAHLQRHL